MVDLRCSTLCICGSISVILVFRCMCLLMWQLKLALIRYLVRLLGNIVCSMVLLLLFDISCVLLFDCVRHSLLAVGRQIVLVIGI